MKLVFKKSVNYHKEASNVLRHIMFNIAQSYLPKERRFFFNISCHNYSVKVKHKNGKIKKIVVY